MVSAGRMITCKSCRTPIEVFEIPLPFVDDQNYTCGECVSRPARQAKPRTDAWWCPKCWDRHELAPSTSRRKQKCPDCDTKMHRCSRYEWFLEDALREQLDATGHRYSIRPQYPVPDHRGFHWYWDLGVWVHGDSVYGGTGLLIDVNGPDHLTQANYSGPGGGYTRDYDKTWELGQQRWHKRGWGHTIILNEDCRREKVQATAADLVRWLLPMSRDHV